MQMTGWDHQPEGESALLEDRPGRGHPLIAWVVILGVIGGTLWLSQQRPRAAEKKPAEVAAGQPLDFQIRAIVGAAEVAPENRTQFYKQIKETLSRLPFHERLKIVPLAGELDSIPEALVQADELGKAAEQENAPRTDRRLLE